MFLHVNHVQYLQNYQLRVTFNDGSVREIDLEAELYGEIFEPLKELARFREVYVNSETGTLEWPNGADFAPEFLYEIGVNVGQVAATEGTHNPKFVPV